MRYPQQIAAYILAGGASSRMGKDKALLEISGTPLIVRTANLVAPLAAKVTMIGDPQKYGTFGFDTIPDREYCSMQTGERSVGPLAGIATALDASSHSWNIVLACDLPYLPREWLEWFLSRPIRLGAQAIVPQTRNGSEPLAAIYHRDCLAKIAAALARGVRKVTDALAELSVEFVPEHEWRHIDLDGRVLRNMNSPEDFEEATKWYELKQADKSHG